MYGNCQTVVISLRGVLQYFIYYKVLGNHRQNYFYRFCAVEGQESFISNIMNLIRCSFFNELNHSFVLLCFFHYFNQVASRTALAISPSSFIATLMRHTIGLLSKFLLVFNCYEAIWYNINTNSINSVIKWFFHIFLPFYLFFSWYLHWYFYILRLLHLYVFLYILISSVCTCLISYLPDELNYVFNLLFSWLWPARIGTTTNIYNRAELCELAVDKC